MAKTREEMQDIALYHMEKINRRSQGNQEKRKTFKDEWKEMERRNKLSPEQRNQEIPYSEYVRKLKDWLNNKEGGRRYGVFTDRFYSWLCMSKRKELEAYHGKGTQYKDMVLWIKEMSEVHINI